MSTVFQTMTDPLILLPVTIFFVVFGLVTALPRRQSPVAARLARHQIGGSQAVSASSPARLASWRPRLQRPALFNGIAARFSSEKSAAQARTLLSRAGSPMTSAAYARLRQMCTLLLTPAFAFLAIAGLGMNLLGFGAAAIVLIAVPRLPAIYLKRIAKKRAQEMDTVISDVLDLLVVCVEGGQSLSAALMQLSHRMDNVAAEEFRHLLADFNTGMSRRDAFNALAARNQSEALAIACTTIIHADKVGMSLGHTLRTLSDMMRTRRRQAAETRARQAPIKMMPVLVGFMLPTMLALLLGPVALEAMKAFK
ncbi:MAG: type II secretion system F family protein [Chloroflexota bacterium]|nr:type II secretion system F family protein [Chloroflexota bacterium]